MSCKSCTQKKKMREIATQKFKVDINKFLTELKKTKQGETNGKEKIK